MHFSTVPLGIFSKRHGRQTHENALFDRAFDDFLKKARSRATRECTFRPCLCRFFVKGTVTPDTITHISTVLLSIFCKRHGQVAHLNSFFDHAFSGAKSDGVGHRPTAGKDSAAHAGPSGVGHRPTAGKDSAAHAEPSGLGHRPTVATEERRHAAQLRTSAESTWLFASHKKASPPKFKPWQRRSSFI